MYILTLKLLMGNSSLCLDVIVFVCNVSSNETWVLDTVEYV